MSLSNLTRNRTTASLNYTNGNKKTPNYNNYTYNGLLAKDVKPVTLYGANNCINTRINQAYDNKLNSILNDHSPGRLTSRTNRGEKDISRDNSPDYSNNTNINYRQLLLKGIEQPGSNSSRYNANYNGETPIKSDRSQLDLSKLSSKEQNHTQNNRQSPYNHRSKSDLHQKTLNTIDNTAKITSLNYSKGNITNNTNNTYIHNSSFINKNTNSNTNTTYTSNNQSSVKGYLDRRHHQSKERIEKLRKEIHKKEQAELSFHPELSKNSKKLVEKIADNMSNKRIRDLNQKNNEIMSNMQKTIDDMNRYKSDLNSKVKTYGMGTNFNYGDKVDKPKTDIEKVRDYKSYLNENEKKSKRERDMTPTRDNKNNNDYRPGSITRDNYNRERPNSVNRDNYNRPSMGINNKDNYNRPNSVKRSDKHNNQLTPGHIYRNDSNNTNNVLDTSRLSYLNKIEDFNVNKNTAQMKVNDYTQKERVIFNNNRENNKERSEREERDKLYRDLTTNNNAYCKTERPSSAHNNSSKYNKTYDKSYNHINESDKKEFKPRNYSNQVRHQQNGNGSNSKYNSSKYGYGQHVQVQPEDKGKDKKYEMNNIIPVTESKNIDFKGFDIFSPPSLTPQADNNPNTNNDIKINLSSAGGTNKNNNNNNNPYQNSAYSNNSYQTHNQSQQPLPQPHQTTYQPRPNSTNQYNIQNKYYQATQQKTNLDDNRGGNSRDRSNITDYYNYYSNNNNQVNTNNIYKNDSTSYTPEYIRLDIYKNKSQRQLQKEVHNRSDNIHNTSNNTGYIKKHEDLNQFKHFANNIDKRVNDEIAKIDSYKIKDPSYLTERTNQPSKLDELSKKYLSNKLSELASNK